MIDLRSDTVTAPTDAMRAVMAAAPVGDDVYDEDPSVRALQERLASMFGLEAGLFVPTGSLANLLAVHAVVPTGGEVLCDSAAHIARAELGAHAAVFGTTMRTWTHPRGLVDRAQIDALIAPDLGPFFVRTAALSIENTHNFGGGAVQDHDAVRAVVDLAHRRGVAVHIDGARIWNAQVATGTAFDAIAGGADVLSVCLSKGLGAPVGSLVLGTAEAIAEARIWRKRLGGGWRQAGILAAAGSYALDHHLERLADDHDHARTLAKACGVDPSTVDTNIVVVVVDDAAAVGAAARADGVLASAVGQQVLRLVTHLGVSDLDVKRACEVLAPLVAG